MYHQQFQVFTCRLYIMLFFFLHQHFVCKRQPFWAVALPYSGLDLVPITFYNEIKISYPTLQRTLTTGSPENTGNKHTTWTQNCGSSTWNLVPRFKTHREFLGNGLLPSTTKHTNLKIFRGYKSLCKFSCNSKTWVLGAFWRRDSLYSTTIWGSTNRGVHSLKLTVRT